MTDAVPAPTPSDTAASASPDGAASADAPLSLVIDTDTASDDAVALLLAARAPEATIRAITLVGGNVPLALTQRNAIVTLDLCGVTDVPVYVGLATPLVRPLETAQDVHGSDGMGGAALPEPSRGADPGHAVDHLRRIATDEPGVHTLVTLGPLTNIATALLLDPDLLTRFRHTYLMAGSPDGVGNVDVSGEYNTWADPEAAAIVFAAPGVKTMVGWNISRLFAVVRPEEEARLRTCGPLGEFCSDINVDVAKFCHEVTGLPGFDLPDPVTMAVALDPSIITDATDEAIAIGLHGPSRGGIHLDRRAEAPEPSCRVVWAVDEAAFKQRLFDACTD